MFLEALLAAVVLLLTLAVGTVLHELTHAAALRLAGIDYDLAFLPAAPGEAGFNGSVTQTLATVTPRELDHTQPAWHLRLSALAPLSLLAPLALLGAGLIPDPTTTSNLVGRALVIGWLACALPSPQDFSIVWHADTVLARQRESGPGIEMSGQEPDVPN